MTTPIGNQTGPPTHWLAELLKERYSKRQGEGRIIRNPIGFEFNREPFDPSSYYKQLGTFRDISRAATNVVNQETINRIEDEREREMAYLRNQASGAVAGIGYKASGSNIEYGLKRITSNVAAAAGFFGSKYGIKNIGGWRARGSVPNSDHPKGRALDYMIKNKKQGTALAHDIIRNYKRWHVTYVIWNRYIWTPRGGWKRYRGPSTHEDHVHVSFAK